MLNPVPITNPDRLRTLENDMLFASNDKSQPREVVPPVAVKDRSFDPEDVEMHHKLMMSSQLPHKLEKKGNVSGQPIGLVTNFYNIDLPKGKVYHYNINITSKRKSSSPKTSEITPSKEWKEQQHMRIRRNRLIIGTLLQTENLFNGIYAAYDGEKNLYTRKPLEIFGHIKCNVQIPWESSNPNDRSGTRTDDLEVTIKPVTKKDNLTCAINLDNLHAFISGKTRTIDQEAVMAVETIMRHYPCTRFYPVGRSFFYPPAEHESHPLGGGREIWFGFHQSLKLGQWKPMVNLDISATTFYQKGPVLKYIADLLNTTVPHLNQIGTLRDSDVKRISKKLKDLLIEVTLFHHKKKFRILNLIKEGANRLKFTVRENGRDVEKTVADYFRQHYNIKLKYPHLPCIKGNRESKNCFLPIEVCSIVEGQYCKKKLEEKQDAELIKFTITDPKQRFDKIKVILDPEYYGNSKYLQEFGVKVSEKPLALEGRVLNPPNIRYCNENKVEPRDGSWDMRNAKFFIGADIESWVFISFSSPSYLSLQHMDKFAKLLVSHANEYGIKINDPGHINIFDSSFVRIQNVLSDMKQKFKAELVIIALPSTNKYIYGEVKQAAETVLGLITQCVIDSNVVKRCNPSLVSNISQKINAKMGGVNSSLTLHATPDILSRPVIIIGAAITYPNHSMEFKHSLVAVVGSLDAHPFRYAIACRAQMNTDEKKKTIEIILDLKNMIFDLLKAFYKSTRGKKPEKIIFYRNGVSEGQFDKVKDYEVKCIREACSTLETGYEPGITFIVARKHHHVRLMTQDHGDGVGRMRNIPPGTTFDNTIVQPFNFDFFLHSHFELQGAGRPTRYIVIEDDNSFSACDLQNLTYYLCHTYVRCTKSISCPAPLRYALLAVLRARQHLLATLDNSRRERTDSPVDDSSYDPLPQSVLDAIKVVDSLKNTMYFV